MQAGLDSLGAVELRNSVSESFKINVPATIAFDYPTFSTLEAFIKIQITGVVEPVNDREVDRHDMRDRRDTNRQERILGEAESKILDIVRGITGAEIPRDQPLMEV